MKDIKMLVSDYDQTFYLNDQNIKINIDMVEQFRKAGNKFVIATGRSYMDFKEKVNLYNINYDYAILNHGAIILDNEDKIIAEYFIDEKIVNKIKKDLNSEKSIKNFCCSTFVSRINFNSNYNPLTKIYSKYESKEYAMYINNKINKNYSEYVNSYYVSTNAVEVISKEINKSKAIKLLANSLKLNQSSIYTIGDGYSDIQMVKDYNGYAMFNSIDELKKEANGVYESVSLLIEDILNNKINK